MNSTTFRQTQHTSQDSAPLHVHQTPTQHTANAFPQQVTSGSNSQTLTHGAGQYQTQFHNNSLPNTSGSQHLQNTYTSPSTATHGEINTGSTTVPQEHFGLRQGNEMGTQQQFEQNHLTSQPTTYQPNPILESKGIIDARSGPDPMQVAEQQKINVAGAPNAAQGRILWLRQAQATNLCSFLINDVLENITLKQIRDPDSAKVHAIAVIQLLRKDPGYGAQFQLILNEIPAWKKYKSQDHSLLITGHEQRADYFLSDGGNGINNFKLLTDR
jgi:hypothetical protein